MPVRNHKSFTATAKAFADARESKTLVGELQGQIDALAEYLGTLPEQQVVEVKLDTKAILASIDQLRDTLTQPRRVRIDVIRDKSGRLERLVATTQGPARAG